MEAKTAPTCFALAVRADRAWKQLGGRGGFARWTVHRGPLAVIY